jgi:hypothetical protein
LALVQGLTKIRADYYLVLISLNIRHFPANCPMLTR